MEDADGRTVEEIFQELHDSGDWNVVKQIGKWAILVDGDIVFYAHACLQPQVPAAGMPSNNLHCWRCGEEPGPKVKAMWMLIDS